MFDDVPCLEDLGRVSGKYVLVRADLNVPLERSPSGSMVVADDFRIQAALPTLAYLVDGGAKVTVASHLGRPHGKPNPELSMEPVKAMLAKLLPTVQVLENLRFDPGEEGNDPAFGMRLTQGQDLYVNDAFGVCHRSHASITFPPTVLPSAAGRLLRRELDALGSVMDSPARPFTLVAGGAKVQDKLGAVRALSSRADQVLVGGAMAFTFLGAMGREVGNAELDPLEVKACSELLEAVTTFELPGDLVATQAGGASAWGDPGSEIRCFIGDVPGNWQALDIGPLTQQRFAEKIAGSATVLWNGPMGVFEDPRFAAGTEAVARAVASCKGFTLIGGGDTVRAVSALGLAGSIGHVSSGGGAMLALIQGEDLPGIVALQLPRTAAPATEPLCGESGRQGRSK